MKGTRETAKRHHRYRHATTAEKNQILNDLNQDRSLNLSEYKKRFATGANQKRPSYLQFHSTLPKEKPIQARTVFHTGLVIDSEGIYWIVKQFNARARHDREPRQARNSPKHEKLAYLISRGRANYAEIRSVHPEDLQGLGLKGNAEDFYLSQVVTTRNSRNGWSHKTAAEAYSAIFVANIFMRKWDQHLLNVAFVGEIPISIDHDVIGPPSLFPHTPTGLAAFTVSFLSFKLIATASHLLPAYAIDASAKECLKDNFVRQNFHDALSMLRGITQGLGLGAGLIQAEGLDAAQIRRSIVAFKSLRQLDVLAAQAGFKGQEREHIVRYLEESQKTLGAVVADIWRRLSGENTPFAQLDSGISALPSKGRLVDPT